MNKIWLIMQAEIGATLRRKLFVIMAFGVPLALGVIALVVIVGKGDKAPSPPTEAQPPAKVQGHEGYVDPSGLIQTVPDTTPAGWLARYPSEAAAEAALEAGQISAYYVVPPDYLATGQIMIVRLTYNPLSDDISSAAFQQVVVVNLLGGDAKLASLVQIPLDSTDIPLAAGEAAAGQDESFRSDILPAAMVLILYLAVLIPASNLVNAVVEEKKNRVMEVLLTSVSPLQMLSGKIVAVGLLGLAQVALYGGVLWAAVHFGQGPFSLPPGASVPTNLLAWSAIYFLLGFAIYGGLLAGLGALVPELKDARTASVILMSPMIAAYLFNIPILDDPGGTLALVVGLFPLTAPVSMIARMSVADVPLWQAVLSAVLQLLTAIGILALIARLFRAQTLLSGQPFSMGRFFRAVVGEPA